MLKFLVLTERFMSRTEDQETQKNMTAKTVIHVNFAVIIDANYALAAGLTIKKAFIKKIVANKSNNMLNYLFCTPATVLSY